MESSIKKYRESLLNPGMPMGDSMKIEDNVHLIPSLKWAEYNFSQFAFNLIARIQGTYQPEQISSWYAMGKS